MADEVPGHWICQVCDETADQDAFIEVINTDIDLGPIGSYPVRSSEPADAATERLRVKLASECGAAPEMVALTAEDLANLEEPEQRIAFVVRHSRCTADREIQGYWFETDRAKTVEDWVAWFLHVSGKTWMGKEDLKRMLAFWWTHKGEQPPFG